MVLRTLFWPRRSLLHATTKATKTDRTQKSAKSVRIPAGCPPDHGGLLSLVVDLLSMHETQDSVGGRDKRNQILRVCLLPQTDIRQRIQLRAIRRLFRRAALRGQVRQQLPMRILFNEYEQGGKRRWGVFRGAPQEEVSTANPPSTSHRAAVPELGGQPKSGVAARTQDRSLTQGTVSQNIRSDLPSLRPTPRP